jgi:cytochrome c-type biogenesis protein CcmH
MMAERIQRLWAPALLAALVLLFGLSAGTLSAQSRMPEAPYANRQLDDPAMEARARDLMHTLRCLVCQGQSIADSDAALAEDMRSQVRERILSGDTPEEITAYLVARYGNWVTYDPPFEADTALLFILPLLAFAGGGWLVWSRFGAAGSATQEEGTP